MTATTRLAILVLTIGFVIEAVGEGLEFFQKSLLGANFVYLYYAGPTSTLFGFLFAFIGRHEWSELHRKHVLHAHRVLAFAIIVLVATGGTVIGLALYAPNAVLPIALPWALGAGAAIGLGSSFVSYYLIAWHLTSRFGKAMLVLSVLTAFAISGAVGYGVATKLPTILSLLHSDPLGIAQALNTITFLSTVLFVSYFLLTLAYHDAYRQLLKGVLPAGHAPAVRPGAPAAKAAPPAPPAAPPASN